MKLMTTSTVESSTPGSSNPGADSCEGCGS